jgi:Phage DNA packaging protein Nu1
MKKPETPEVFGRKLNKTDLAREFGVSLQTVDQWLHKGCPVLGREGAQLMFDSVRVTAWREARLAAGGELLGKSRADITREVQAMFARCFLWFHSDSARAADDLLCKGLRKFGQAVENFQGLEDEEPQPEEPQ